MITELWTFVNTHKRKIAFIFLLIQLQGILLLVFPFINVFVYDDLLISNDNLLYIKIVLGIILLLIAFASTTLLLDYLLADIRSKAIEYYRLSYVQILLTKKYNHFVDGNPGDFVQKIIPDIDIIADSFVKIINGFLSSFQSLILFSGLWLLDKMLFSVFASLFILYSIWVHLWNKRIKSINEAIGKDYGLIYSLIYEVLQGIKDIKFFNKYDYVNYRLQTTQRALSQKFLKSSIVYSLQGQSSSFIPWIGYILLVGVCTIGPSQNKYSIGFLVSILSLMWRLLSPIDKVTEALFKLKEGENAFARINKIKSLQDEALPNEKILDKKVNIEFKSVSFSYKNRSKILNNINLKICQGEKIAIVGSSGSGKSTFVNILSGINSEYTGEVLLNGVDLRQYKLESLRDRLAIVSQDVFLFNDTLIGNITLNSQLESKQLALILKKTLLDDMVSKLVQHENTMVGDRGLLLSGGERQRISIARTLTKNPSILILDEATSALDKQTENTIWDLINVNFPGVTMICITHRKKVLEGMDRIYRIKEGEMFEIDVEKADLKNE